MDIGHRHFTCIWSENYLKTISTYEIASFVNTNRMESRTYKNNVVNELVFFFSLRLCSFLNLLYDYCVYFCIYDILRQFIFQYRRHVVMTRPIQWIVSNRLLLPRERESPPPLERERGGGVNVFSGVLQILEVSF